MDAQQVGAMQPRDALHLLQFDAAFPFVGTDHDPRLSPRLPLHVRLPDNVAATERLRPVLDTGAEHTILDGNVAVRFGWTEDDIRMRAVDSFPIYGLDTAGPPLSGFLHRVTLLIALGDRFAELDVRLFLTMPNTLATPVLGRRGFFEHVDFALVQAEQRFYLRFRDPSAIRQAW
jgi:hypothetical protein